MLYFEKHLRIAKHQTIVCSEHQALFVRKCAPSCSDLPARKDVCPAENLCRDVCENCSASCLLSNFSDRTLKVNLSECSPVQDCCAHRLETGCKSCIGRIFVCCSHDRFGQLVQCLAAEASKYSLKLFDVVRDMCKVVDFGLAQLWV